MQGPRVAACNSVQSLASQQLDLAHVRTHAHACVATQRDHAHTGADAQILPTRSLPSRTQNCTGTLATQTGAPPSPANQHGPSSPRSGHDGTRVTQLSAVAWWPPLGHCPASPAEGPPLQ